MAGIDFIFNVAKGRTRTLAQLTGNQRLVWVLLQNTGLEADAVLRDYDNLAVLIAASNTEATFTNYARANATNVTVTVDDTADELRVAADPITFLAAGGGLNNTLHKALLCHDPDITTGTDTDVIPVAAYNVTITTDGTDITLTPSATGLYAAT